MVTITKRVVDNGGKGRSKTDNRSGKTKNDKCKNKLIVRIRVGTKRVKLLDLS